MPPVLCSARWPGEIVTIFGSAIGPVSPAGVQLTTSGTVATNVSGTSVMFNGIAAPIIYTLDGTVNSESNGATYGVISIFATGEGQTNLPGIDGAINADTLPLPVPQLPVTVQIDGLPMMVLYAGGAPGEVAGVLQINAEIPGNIAPGDFPITITIGGATSQPVTVTITCPPNARCPL